MSEQIFSEKKPVAPAEIVIQTKTEVAQPKTQETKPKQERRRGQRRPRRKSDSSEGKKSSDGQKPNSKYREDQMFIGNKSPYAYIAVLKKQLDKFEQIDLTGGFNGKVIFIVNQMVSWGYCTVSKIKTIAPSQLEIKVKRSPNFYELVEAHEVVKAKKAEAHRAKKAEVKAQKDAEKARAEKKETDIETEKVAMSAVQAVVDAN